MISAIDLLDRDEINGVYGVPLRHVKHPKHKGMIYVNSTVKLFEYLSDNDCLVKINTSRDKYLSGHQYGLTGIDIGGVRLSDGDWIIVLADMPLPT